MEFSSFLLGEFKVGRIYTLLEPSNAESLLVSPQIIKEEASTSQSVEKSKIGPL